MGTAGSVSLRIIAVSIVAAAPAFADPLPGSAMREDHPPTASHSPPETRARYGWQTLTVDVAGVVTGIVLTSALYFDSGRRPRDLGLVGGAWYGIGAVGAPAVHYAHGNVGGGAASFGLRTLVPPVTGAFGFIGLCLARHDSRDGCVSEGFTGGTLVGLAGVAAVDAIWLADPKIAREKDSGREWYGWQTLVVDGAGVGLGMYAAASARDNEGNPIHPALGTWAIGYTVGLIGGPIVHFGHGRWGTGFGSLGLRALVGPMGALPGLMGYCAATGGVKGCAGTGASWGLLGGLATVSLFDALVLAHDPVADAKHTAYLPVVSVGPGSVFVGGYLP